MSCSLHYRPIKSGTYVGDINIRDPIEDEFGLPCVLNEAALPFLRGLLHGHAKDGAQRIIDAISRHGAIELYKEC